MTPFRHQLREEFMIPDKAGHGLVDTILTQGMELLDQGADSVALEDVVINLHLARTSEKAVATVIGQPWLS